jgi:FixJ family two-component response regulator
MRGQSGGRHGVENREIQVVLVDDDETWADSTAQVLEHQREVFTVETATGLSAASAAIAEFDPDCVVCDYRLEAGTGLDLLAEVREQGDRPFILVTGQGNESVASDAIGNEVTDYIPKRSLGGRSDLLARRVESAVEAHRTRQALARERRSREAMLDILRATSSREGVAREFCAHLVGTRAYACVMVATRDQSGGVVEQAAAGETAYLDSVVNPGATPAGPEPALAALADGQARFVAIEATRGDETTADWRETARTHGFAAAAAVPIEHDGHLRGVLAVYATRPLDADERDLLVEYGETIGYALRSAGWRESLLDTSPVRVAVDLTDPAVPLVAFDAHLDGAQTTVLTTAPRDEGLLYVLRVTGTTAEKLRAAGQAATPVESLSVLAGDPLRVELIVSRPTPETILADREARVVGVSVAEGRASMTVADSEGSVRSLVEAVRAEYPDAGVRSVRADDAETAGVGVLDDLTDKQRQAIELALYSGYFGRPREHSATELAAKLDISRQTFAQHLRAGQRKLLSELLDGASSPPAR